MITERIEAIITAHPWGKASAVKRGRNPRFPYVPVIDHTNERRARTEQIRAKAFTERDDAVAYAASVIEARKNMMRKHFLMPHMRAYRQQYGLPYELPTEGIAP